MDEYRTNKVLFIQLFRYLDDLPVKSIHFDDKGAYNMYNKN